MKTQVCTAVVEY